MAKMRWGKVGLADRDRRAADAAYLYLKRQRKAMRDLPRRWSKTAAETLAQLTQAGESQRDRTFRGDAQNIVHVTGGRGTGRRRMLAKRNSQPLHKMQHP